VRLPPCGGTPTEGPSREGCPHGQQERTSVQVRLSASPRGRGGAAGLPPDGHALGQRGKLPSRRTLGGHRRYARADIESLVERLEKQIGASPSAGIVTPGSPSCPRT